MDRGALLAPPELRENPVAYHGQTGPRLCRVPQLAAQFRQELSGLAKESIPPAVFFGYPCRNQSRMRSFLATPGVATQRFVRFSRREELAPAQFLQSEHDHLLYEPAGRCGKPGAFVRGNERNRPRGNSPSKTCSMRKPRRSLGEQRNLMASND
jgi:hypothetical protein